MATKKRTTAKDCDRWDTVPDTMYNINRPGDNKKKPAAKPAGKAKPAAKKK